MIRGATAHRQIFTHTFTDLTRESKLNEENNALNKAPELPSCIMWVTERAAESGAETITYSNCELEKQNCLSGLSPRHRQDKAAAWHGVPGDRVPVLLPHTTTQHNSQTWLFFLVHASTVKTCRPAMKMINLFYWSTVTEKKPSR